MQTFPLATVLSVFTCRLLCLYDEHVALLAFLTGEKEVYTHEICRLGDECHAWLLKQCPQLEKINTDAIMLLKHYLASLPTRESGIAQWCKVLRHIGLPATIALSPMPDDHHVARNTVEEFQEMMGSKPYGIVEIFKE